jgi:hypothetical protein
MHQCANVPTQATVARSIPQRLATATLDARVRHHFRVRVPPHRKVPNFSAWAILPLAENLGAIDAEASVSV